MTAPLFFANKTILITGAAGGIGAASAAALHARGANIVLADLKQDAVDNVADQIGRTRILPLAVDVTDNRCLAEAVERIMDQFGSVDVVFANAGIAADRRPPSPPSILLNSNESSQSISSASGGRFAQRCRTSSAAAATCLSPRRYMPTSTAP
ncbi:SDR family NAD(P)-dependent oxidoreductase [Mycolicibacterium sp. CBMA 226]|uniref:SDR family NAD(P)-dependent oxidoreductase n=1 Tax=Mycolicibacterium sp. CBMA 226 TaxID=2606611 RepID=UPI0013173920|nr:SDR family NAD(P)-dependent oxidoreductase [Mycolicibacterium sp. CBMA 226]QGW61299.1 putative oxidoreductase [Mycolicibacterium sp.]